MANALQLLGEPRRMEMLQLVWDTERAAGDIARHFQITFGAVSQHLGILWRSGLLRRRRDGKRILYSADKAALGPLAVALEAMWSDRLATLKKLAETEQMNMNKKSKLIIANEEKR